MWSITGSLGVNLSLITDVMLTVIMETGWRQWCNIHTLSWQRWRTLSERCVCVMWHVSDLTQEGPVIAVLSVLSLVLGVLLLVLVVHVYCVVVVVAIWLADSRMSEATVNRTLWGRRSVVCSSSSLSAALCGDQFKDCRRRRGFHLEEETEILQSPERILLLFKGALQHFYRL